MLLETHSKETQFIKLDALDGLGQRPEGRHHAIIAYYRDIGIIIAIYATSERCDEVIAEFKEAVLDKAQDIFTFPTSDITEDVSSILRNSNLPSA